MEVPDNIIFKSLQAYSPTGKPKRLPATLENIKKYQKYLISMKRFMAEGEALGHEYPDKERILAELKPAKGTMNLDLKALSHKHHKTAGSMAQKLSGRRVSPFEPGGCKSFMSSATQS